MRSLTTCVVALLVVAFGVNCGPRPTPTPQPEPSPVTATVRVEVFEGDPRADLKVPGALVVLDGIAGNAPRVADAAGNVEWVSVPPGPRHLWVDAPGYRPFDQHLEIAPGVGHTILASLTPVPRIVKGRLQARARALTYPDGSVFRWRGVTAFALVAQVAHGQEEAARAYLQWAHDTGFSLVRVLAMCSWLDLSPEAGLAALPRTLELVRSYDLYTEVVALSDTRTWPGLDLGAHVAAVGRIALAHDHVVMELVNEPHHQVNDAGRLTPDHLATYRQLVPREVLVAYGASANDESEEYSGGDYITAHLDRSRDGYNQVRRVREFEALSSRTGKPVVNDEPMGFGETTTVVRPDGSRYDRWTDPSLAFAFGVLARVMEVGTTFHLEAGLGCAVPGPVQRAAAQAFIAGTRVVPDDVVLRFANARFASAGWDQSPVERFETTRAVRVYSGLGTLSVTVALGLSGDAGIEYRLGYGPRRVLAERPGVTVWEIGR